MKIHLIAFSLLLAISAYGQDTLIEEWFITRSGSNSFFDYSNCVDVDENENIYWPTTRHIDDWGNSDIYTYKISAAGDEIWQSPYIYGGCPAQSANSVDYKDGVVFIGGHTSTCTLTSTCFDALVYAIDDHTKDLLWSWEWDGNNDRDLVNSIKVEGDSIYAIGATIDSVTGHNNIFLVKFDLNGNVLWQTIWDSPYDGFPFGDIVLDDNKIYFTGEYSDQALLAVFDQITGNYLWHTLWGGAESEFGFDLVADSAYLYQCGYTGSFADSITFINKYDFSGNLLWTVFSDITYGNSTFSLEYSLNNKLYLGANTNILGAGNEDVLLMQFNPANGELIEYKTWGSPNREMCYYIKIMNEFIYITGEITDYDNYTNDALLLKAPLFTITDTEDHKIANEITIFPNPTIDKCWINIAKSSVNTSIKVYNSFGVLIDNISEVSNGQIKLNTTNWKQGMYFVNIEGFGVLKLIKK